MREKPIVHQRRTLGETGIFHIEEMELEFSNGARRNYQRLRGSAQGAVMIVPLLDADTLLLVREYAAGMDRYELAFPKGRVEADEEILIAANRELQEEVGYAAERMQLIAAMTVAPGYLFHETHLVLARSLHPSKLPGDEPEEIEVVPWGLDRLAELLQQPDFTEARSIAAAYMTRDLLQRECD
ncbi:MAG: ADP compounds hydrolase NudE [Gammaproteobacteria bacterium]|nr:ADP compounds hydrolase NudE [Gammaproteobacteria bacterium]